MAKLHEQAGRDEIIDGMQDFHGWRRRATTRDGAACRRLARRAAVALWAVALGDRAPIGRPHISTRRPCGYPIIRYGAYRARADIWLSDTGRIAPVRLGRQ